MPALHKRHASCEASASDIAGAARCGYAMASALTETALARKLKHPKGLKYRYTFRIGPSFSSELACAGGVLYKRTPEERK